MLSPVAALPAPPGCGMIGAVEPYLRSPAIGPIASRGPLTAATVAADRHRLRMLAVLAAPVAGAKGGRPIGQPLDVWGEWERLRAAIGVRDALDGGGVPWAVARLTPATAESLADTLAAAGAGFQVVHFGCHGGPHGLHVEDDVGRERELPTAQLVNALRGRGVELLVLNACETAELAQALVEQAGVRAAVATREPIYDGEARVLAERLYRGLALGRPVGEALAAARETIATRHLQGDFGISRCSVEVAALRADHLVLVGDPTLTLAVEEPAAATPLFVLDPTPRNDPLRLDLVTDFVGRHDELLRLARWFAETGWLAFAISGVGGVGKTALALNAALRAAHRFDALAVASARDNPDLSLARVLEAIAAAQNAPASSDETADPAAAVARRMNAARVLLVLDNLETVTKERSAELTRTLAGVRPESGSRVLLTLRPQERGELTNLVPHGNRLALTTFDRPNALRKAWNQAERDGLLADPPPPALATLSKTDAEDLARTAREAWLQADDSSGLQPWLHALDDLAARAFCHPKMIELAVSLVADRGWPAARLRLTQLAGREVTAAFDELIGGLVDDLAAADPQTLDVLHAALVFRGGAAAPLLRFVALGRQVEEGSGEVIEFEDGPLEAARRSNLLSRTEIDARGAARFDLDPPIRAYLERVRPPVPERLEALRMRHAEALVRVLKENAKALVSSEIHPAAIPEWSNLTAAWEWLAAEPAGPRGKLLLAHAERWYNLVFGVQMMEGRAWLEAALVAAREKDSQRDEAQALYALATRNKFVGEFDTSFEQYQAALALSQICGDRSGQAKARRGLAELGIVASKFREGALDHCREALALFRSLDDKFGEGNAWSALGDLLRLENELDGSLRSHQEALDLSRQVGYRLGEANALIGIGVVALLRGEQQAADQWLEEAISIYRETGHHYNVAVQIGNFARELLRVGRLADARPYVARAAEFFELLGPGFELHRDRHRSVVEEIDDRLSA